MAGEAPEKGERPDLTGQHRRLGRALLAAGPVTHGEVLELIGSLSRPAGPLGEALLHVGFPSEDDLISVALASYRIPRVRLDSFTLSPEVIRLIPGEVAVRCRAFPLGRIGSLLIAATPQMEARRAASLRREWGGEGGPSPGRAGRGGGGAPVALPERVRLGPSRAGPPGRRPGPADSRSRHGARRRPSGLVEFGGRGRGSRDPPRGPGAGVRPRPPRRGPSSPYTSPLVSRGVAIICLISAAIGACQSRAVPEGRTRAGPGRSPDLILRGEVLEMRDRPSGVVAIVRAREVRWGILFREEVECLLGNGWWRVPVREGESYTFNLAYRLGAAQHSFAALPWPEGIVPGDLPTPEGPPPAEEEGEDLGMLLQRIRTGAITPKVERKFLAAGRKASPGLLEALMEGDGTTRWNAARLLALIPYPEAAPYLGEMAKVTDPKLRMAAVGALRETRTGEALQMLAAFLDDSSPMVRSLAVDAIGRHRSREGLPGIIPALKDPAPQVRLEAARALGRIGGPSAAIALGGMISSASQGQDLQAEAIDALGRTGAAEAIPHLERTLGEGESGLVGEAVRALLRLGDIGVPSILGALGSEDPYVRWQAVRALRSLTNKRFGYRADGPADARSQAVRRWRGWWKGRR